MKYDFRNFLNESKINCKSKIDFINKINDERTLISKSNDSQNFKERQLFLKRLDDAKFCTEKGVVKEKDVYNSELLSLLDRLE